MAAGDPRSTDVRRVTGLTDLGAFPVPGTTFEELLTSWAFSLREVWSTNRLREDERLGFANLTEEGEDGSWGVLEMVLVQSPRGFLCGLPARGR